MIFCAMIIILIKNNKFMEYEIEFDEFSMNNMVDDPAILIVAKRGSGKSVITREIMEKMNEKINIFIVISNTEKVNPFYSKFVPDSYIYNEYKPSILEKIFRR